MKIFINCCKNLYNNISNFFNLSKIFDMFWICRLILYINLQNFHHNFLILSFKNVLNILQSFPDFNIKIFNIFLIFMYFTVINISYVKILSKILYIKLFLKIKCIIYLFKFQATLLNCFFTLIWSRYFVDQSAPMN